MSLYKQRDLENLEPHYGKHVSAITGEKLHGKSDIAAELAWRDQRIAELEKEIDRRQATLDRRQLNRPTWARNHRHEVSIRPRNRSVGNKVVCDANVRRPFKLKVSKEWCEKMAKLEGNHEVGAGALHLLEDEPSCYHPEDIFGDPDEFFPGNDDEFYSKNDLHPRGKSDE